MRLDHPLKQSIALHFFFVVGFLVLHFFLRQVPKPETVSLKILEKINTAPVQTTPENLNVSQSKAQVQKAKSEPEAFGLNQQSLTDPSSAKSEIKKGNTFTKEVDQIQSEGTALPRPVDQFLVTRMPKVKKEIKAAYPAKAKALGIEGSVIVDLLIDETGKVRNVQLVRGVGQGLDEAALEALAQYEFEPAYIQNEAVVVQIRYSYKFILD